MKVKIKNGRVIDPASGEDQIRVLKLALESRLNGRIAMDHPTMSWLIAYAGWIVSRQEVGHDGRTAYERWRGRPYRGELMEFGARCY